MNPERPNPMTQTAIREIVQVIRQWYLTICHDLCIDPPAIRIRKPVHVPMFSGRNCRNISESEPLTE